MNMGPHGKITLSRDTLWPMSRGWEILVKNGGENSSFTYLIAHMTSSFGWLIDIKFNMFKNELLLVLLDLFF